MLNKLSPSQTDQSQEIYDLDPQDYVYVEDEDGNASLEEPTEEIERSIYLEDPSKLDELVGINLADPELEYLEEETLEEIKDMIMQYTLNDLESMAGHFSTLREGADLLGIDLKEHGLGGDWSCGATHPLIIENAIKMQGMAINELDPPDKIVKTKVIQTETDPDIEQKATRKQEFTNYVICDLMDDTFYPESAKCWLGAALHGVGYKKNSWNSLTQCIESEYLPIDSVIVNNATKRLQTAPWYSTLEPTSNVRISSGMASGEFRKIALGGDESYEDGQRRSSDGSESPVVSQGAFEVTQALNDKLGFEADVERILMHTYIYLDVNELFEAEEQETPQEEANEYFERNYLPFVVVTELMSGEILSITANWDKEDPKRQPLSYVTDYHFIRGFGFFSLGYIHILGNFAKMLTGIMRSLVDAGTFSTLPAGFKLKGTKMGGSTDFAPGEFKEVESTAQDISKAIMALPFKEPSTVFTNLFTILSDGGQKFANSAEGVTQEAANYGAVGTTLALLESSSRLTNSILRGFHQRRKHEIAVITRLIRENYADEYPYEASFQEDFDPKVKIVPCSDPNMPTQAQRMAMAQAKMDIALKMPQIHDVREAVKGVYLAMGVQNVDKLLPPPQQSQPMGPMEDCLAAAGNQPIRAFEGQDHKAHIAFKTAFIQNPDYANSEFFKMAIPAITSNIREHMMLDLQEKVGAATTGAATDPQSQAQNQARVMQELTQMAQIAAQSAANAEDPTVQLARAQAEKNRIDEKRTDSQEVRDFAKILIDKEELDVKKKELAHRVQVEDNKITADLTKVDSNNESKLLQQALALLGTSASRGRGEGSGGQN